MIENTTFLCYRWRSRNRLGYIRKTNSFCTASVGRGGCAGQRFADNGGSIFHGCENSDHPLIYDDANINFISQCGSASSNRNPTNCVSASSDNRKNISNSLMCPSASSTSNTYLIDINAVQDKNQVSNSTNDIQK